MAELKGTCVPGSYRVAIVVARFNNFVTVRLLEGALDAYERMGGERSQVDVVHVPGAFELPLAAKRLAEGGRYGALVALAAVVRGSTPHFEYVCSAATTGLAAVMRDSGVPIGFGVLTTETVEQAIDRAGAKAGNKGAEAMATAIEMANLLAQLR
jgi:6,7-dimethyl-8-ribityllumazine synthase